MLDKNEIAHKLNEYFKEFDPYNYRDSVSTKLDEEEVLLELENCLTDVSEVEEFKKQLKLYKEENPDKDEMTELDKLIKTLDEYLEKNKITILNVEPYKEPTEKEIINDLKAMQREVDGLIEIVDIDPNISIVCNEEGKIMNLPFNRLIENDIIAGSFFVVSFDEEGNAKSLNKEEIEKYKEKFDKRNIAEMENKIAAISLGIGGNKLC
ncbi:MAG: DUF3846 domain-containing protein [Tenericutes bacterium]|nr:DUF3846 domain-containing protein [Mycoplasmatota bacterium]